MEGRSSINFEISDPPFEIETSLIHSDSMKANLSDMKISSFRTDSLKKRPSSFSKVNGRETTIKVIGLCQNININISIIIKLYPNDLEPSHSQKPNISLQKKKAHYNNYQAKTKHG